jgi:predicted PurR-regulated permease PerM
MSDGVEGEGPGARAAGPSSPPDRPWDETVWRVVLAVAALGVLGLLLFSVRGLLNPFVLFWIFIAAMVPFRGAPGHHLWVSLAALLTLYWLLATTGTLIAPFVLAFMLAYVLDPLVDKLEARGVGRALAIGLLALPVLGALAGILIVGIPAVVAQAAELVQATPVLLERMTGWADSLAGWLGEIDFPGVDEGVIAERLRAIDPDQVVHVLQQSQEQIRAAVLGGVVGLGRGLGTALSIVSYVFLTPVLTFYLLRDYDGIVARMRDLIPRDREARVVEFFGEYDVLLSAYLRGQLTVALILGALTTTLLLIVQFPYAILLGSLAAVLSVVPYLGLVLSLIPALVIALISGSVLVSLLKVVLVYGGTQALEGAVISPRIVGESVGLHPVWVVLALSLGGFFFGFVGFLIAVPAAVGIKLLTVRGVDEYRSSELYRG